MSAFNAVFSPFRLAAGAFVVALLAIPLYLFILGPANDGDIAPANLLDTPGLEARSLSVGVGEGKLAADFDISTPDGARVRLSELRGRPVLINFWARWCTSCLSEMPEIKALQSERGIDAVTVLAINAGETPSQAQEFIDFLEAPFIYGLDTDLTVADAYGVYGLPLSVFIDSDGVIQAVYSGHANSKLLATLTDAAINARPPGPLPPILRIISTIERSRRVDVTALGAGRLRIDSRSLRCDPSYCASDAIEELRLTQGISTVSLDGNDAIVVEHHALQITAEGVGQRLLDLLRLLPDPVYQAELELRFLSAP
jgi:thiol-disulfide isomerase/thioredoxin